MTKKPAEFKVDPFSGGLLYPIGKPPFKTGFQGEYIPHEDYKVAIEVIESLWRIIDDIDTAGDIAKSNDVVYRKIVEKRQKERWETGITSDGYTLDLSKMKGIPSGPVASDNNEANEQFFDNK